MAKLKIPYPQKIKEKNISSFLGADFSKSSDISYRRSPDILNMIRETPGKVRKWQGYETLLTLSGRINGVHFYSDGTRFIHAGTRLYEGTTLIKEGLGDNMSSSCQLNGKMLIFDGKRALCIERKDGKSEVSFADERGTVPVTVIGIEPSGGGTVLNPVNMLSPKREVRARSNDKDKIFQMPYKDLDAEEVKIKALNADGTFKELKENVDFTVDRKTGKITFVNIPPLPPLKGEDNLYITLQKTNLEYKKKINSALSCVVFGERGARNRIFCAGEGNRDYHSEFNDPLYFGDISYSVLGSDSSCIMGYTVLNDKLASILDKADDNATVILREGQKIGDRTEFVTSGSCKGPGALSRHGFSVLNTEPLYPTSSGICAVTSDDYSNEKYSQNRSFFLNKKLGLKNLKDSCACFFNDFYMLAAEGTIFALDGLQVSVSPHMPYSTRQYEGYVREGTGARIIWEENSCLYFGTDKGEIKRFFNAPQLLSSYNDDGKPISSVWTTPVFTGEDFKRGLKMKSIYALLASYAATSCRIWAVYDGEKELICDYNSQGRFFSFSQLTFSKLTFRTDRTGQKISERLSFMNPEGGIYFIFQNDILNEPFSLEEVSFEYREKR